MERRTQTRLFAVLVCGLLALLFGAALAEAGYWQGNVEAEPVDVEIDRTDLNIVNDTSGAFIYSHKSGFVYVFDYIGEFANEVRWDFGDGKGATGVHVYNRYPDNGEYLLTMTAETNTTEIIQHTYISVNESIAAQVNIPGTNYKITLFNSTLFFSAVFLMITAIIYAKIDDLPFSGFTPELRVITAIGFIVCSITSLGFFNPILGGVG